jgi:hypothetical protein
MACAFKSINAYRINAVTLGRQCVTYGSAFVDDLDVAALALAINAAGLLPAVSRILMPLSMIASR